MDERVDPAVAAADLLRGATRVAVLTGAGMSAESGVPTFRDSLTGLWSDFDAERLATPSAFRDDPATVFGWYLSRIRGASAVEPHPGYGALVDLESRVESVVIITQNVDGLHARSGSRRVIELHGSLAQARCFDAGHPFPFERMLSLAGATTDDAVPPPVCEECGSLIRPGVVWFGEPLPDGAMEDALEQVVRADVVLLAGTSSVVYPAAQLPTAARAAGVPVVEINPDRTPFTDAADVYWNERAGIALPRLVALSAQDATES